MRDFAPVFSYRAEDMPFHRPLGQEQAVGDLLGAAVRRNHLGKYIPFPFGQPVFCDERLPALFVRLLGSRRLLGLHDGVMRAVYTAIATLTVTNSTRAMTMAARLLPVASSATDPLVIRAALTLFMARPMPAHSDGRRICRESSIKLAVKKTTKKPEDR